MNAPNMTWDLVLSDCIIPLLEGDAQLVAALGGLHIYAQDASREIIIPSVVWDLLDDQLEGIFNPIDTQWDYFARNKDEAVTIEGRLRTLLHRDVHQTINGINMATLYRGGFTHPAPTPGVTHRSLRFTFKPARHIVAAVDS